MIDLKDVAFLIPIRLESEDRKFNFEYVVNYLCKHFSTNILVRESDIDCPGAVILRRTPKQETDIKYWYECSIDPVFHRTRLINEMLSEVTTPVVCVLDCDILLEVNTYVRARNTVLDGIHFVYPYFLGLSQLKIVRPGLNSNLLEEQKHIPSPSVAGHCFFADTKSYREAGMEQELFIGWAPEDSERQSRFRNLGYKVMHLDGCYIYHIEHSRGINSSKDNPMFKHNEQLYKKLSTMTPDQLREYYKNVEYIKKYRK